MPGRIATATRPSIVAMGRALGTFGARPVAIRRPTVAAAFRISGPGPVLGVAHDVPLSKNICAIHFLLKCKKTWGRSHNEMNFACDLPQGMFVRRCPTLPHRGRCSTIGAEGLSFRVRNGTGRFPLAMTAVTLWNYLPATPTWLKESGVVVVPEPHSGRESSSW